MLTAPPPPFPQHAKERVYYKNISCYTNTDHFLHYLLFILRSMCWSVFIFGIPTDSPDIFSLGEDLVEACWVDRVGSFMTPSIVLALNFHRGWGSILGPVVNFHQIGYTPEPPKCSNFHPRGGVTKKSPSTEKFELTAYHLRASQSLLGRRWGDGNIKGFLY